MQVVDKDNRILELLKGTNSAQSLAARHDAERCPETPSDAE
jgi:hypothetical protein